MGCHEFFGTCISGHSSRIALRNALSAHTIGVHVRRRQIDRTFGGASASRSASRYPASKSHIAHHRASEVRENHAACATHKLGDQAIARFSSAGIRQDEQEDRICDQPQRV